MAHYDGDVMSLMAEGFLQLLSVVDVFRSKARKKRRREELCVAAPICIGNMLGYLQQCVSQVPGQSWISWDTVRLWTPGRRLSWRNAPSKTYTFSNLNNCNTVPWGGVC